MHEFFDGSAWSYLIYGWISVLVYIVIIWVVDKIIDKVRLLVIKRKLDKLSKAEGPFTFTVDGVTYGPYPTYFAMVDGFAEFARDRKKSGA